MYRVGVFFPLGRDLGSRFGGNHYHISELLRFRSFPLRFFFSSSGAPAEFLDFYLRIDRHDTCALHPFFAGRTAGTFPFFFFTAHCFSLAISYGEIIPLAIVASIVGGSGSLFFGLLFIFSSISLLEKRN